jgi:hypothetical protein
MPNGRAIAISHLGKKKPRHDWDVTGPLLHARIEEDTMSWCSARLAPYADRHPPSFTWSERDRRKGSHDSGWPSVSAALIFLSADVVGYCLQVLGQELA